MNTKNEILKILRENKGNYVSGEYISNILGVTRNSIWKSINTLRKSGYKIDAITNKGYKLNESNNFSNLSINEYLEKEYKVIYYESVTSTNDIGLELGVKNENDKTIIVADEQTKGRGRKGRNFFSPNKSGLYFSIILRPKLNIQESLYITAIAAVSVVNAIEEITGIKTYIKWVNDIYLNNKKICGILTDAKFDIESGVIEYATVGIGINLFEPINGYPNDIENIATSILQNKKIDNKIKSKLVAKIINNFFSYYENIENKSFMKEYKEKNFIVGKSITIELGERKEKVKVISIDDNCRLEIINNKGDIEKITYGEVSLEI